MLTPTQLYGTSPPLERNHHVTLPSSLSIQDNNMDINTYSPSVERGQTVISSPSSMQDRSRLYVNEGQRRSSNDSSLPADSSADSSVTKSAMEKITSGKDSIVIRSSLPPLDVVKFSGDPHEYYRFKSRFHEMVDSQNISDAQKMSRLLQFLEGKARKAVGGFEGVPGGLNSALRLLEQRYGQPHIVAKSCVDTLVVVD